MSVCVCVCAYVFKCCTIYMFKIWYRAKIVDISRNLKSHIAINFEIFLTSDHKILRSTCIKREFYIKNMGHKTKSD